VRDFSRRKVKISHCTVNPPTEYKNIIISQLLHDEISRGKVQKRVANLGYFSLKRQICGFFGNCKKYYKNMTFFRLGWQPGFQRTGTYQ
jgi:hypothetical protein